MTELSCRPSGGEWKNDQCKCSDGVVLVRSIEKCPDNNKYEFKLDWKLGNL
jgi:hypothetical protein